MRPTDHARMLIRKAQIGLAVAAVPVAVAIGVIATDPTLSTLPSPVSYTALQQQDPVADSEPRPIGVLARAEDVAERVVADHDPQNQPMSGVTTGLCTLAVCWALLAAASAIWRRRLDGRDLDDWAEGWARVEPPWSNRR